MLKRDNLPFYLSHVVLEDEKDEIDIADIDEKYKYIEPNAYVHAIVSGDKEIDSTLLYQTCMIDDYDGESGGTKQFQDEFLAKHVYRRWESEGTYYTALDYGAVTYTTREKTVYKGQNEDGVFPDLLLQHHTKQYLLFIALQLFYRDELQELMGRYARVGELGASQLSSRKETITRAKKILKDYYKLNQHFFFDRVSLEIQGLELWKFYQNTLGVKELYHAVQEDMRELNNRLIEVASEKQNKVTENLTVVAALTGLFGMNLIIPWFEEFPFKFSGFSNVMLSTFSILFHIGILGVIILVVSLTVKSNLFKGVVNKILGIFKGKEKSEDRR